MAAPDTRRATLGLIACCALAALAALAAVPYFGFLNLRMN
jgi:hypothetical protein